MCIATGRVLDDPKRPRDYSAEQYLKIAGGDGGAVRRRARGARERGRAGQALQPRAEARQLLPARVPGARSEHTLEYLDRASRAARASARGSTKHAARAGLRARRTTTRAWTLELDVIVAMGFPGYFLIVADFINWAKAQRHPGRSGPRFGRRLAGRLGAGHHRPRPAALRPAVRALPQSRTRVDARLRHRLLHGPPRRGDRLRRAQVRPRPRQPDHHLRHHGGEGRGARHRPRARPSLRLRRRHRQAHSA